jgi:hypothetical protein
MVGPLFFGGSEKASSGRSQKVDPPRGLMAGRVSQANRSGEKSGEADRIGIQ